jgi:hypothetical protein
MASLLRLWFSYKVAAILLLEKVLARTIDASGLTFLIKLHSATLPRQWAHSKLDA